MKQEEIKIKGEELITKIKELIHEGNVRRIVLKDDKDNVLFKVPLTIGLIGIILAPVWAAIGTIAALIGNLTLTVERNEDADFKDVTPKSKEKSKEK